MTTHSIPTFFINLDQHTDRRQFIESQLAAAGFHAERIAGIDGDKLPEFLSSYFPRSSLSPGEIGCYASHLIVWQTIVTRGLPYALVLEDDVEVGADAAQLVADVIHTLSPGWDFVHLSEKPRSRRFAARPLKSLPHNRKLVRYARVPDGTFAYLISHSGAQKLLSPVPRLVPIDTDIRRPWDWGLDLYGVTNSPFRPANFSSTIAARGGHSRRQRKHWLGSGFRSFHSFAFNIRKLGPYWWVRCFAENALSKASRRRLKRRSDSPARSNHFYHTH